MAPAQPTFQAGEARCKGHLRRENSLPVPSVSSLALLANTLSWARLVSLLMLWANNQSLIRSRLQYQGVYASKLVPFWPLSYCILCPSAGVRLHTNCTPCTWAANSNLLLFSAALYCSPYVTCADMLSASSLSLVVRDRHNSPCCIWVSLPSALNAEGHCFSIWVVVHTGSTPILLPLTITPVCSALQRCALQVCCLCCTRAAWATLFPQTPLTSRRWRPSCAALRPRGTDRRMGRW